MSRLTSGYRGTLTRLADDARGMHPFARREEPFGAYRGWLIAGLVAVGVGAMAFHFLGPDVKRYLKLRNM